MRAIRKVVRTIQDEIDKWSYLNLTWSHYRLHVTAMLDGLPQRSILNE